LLLYVFAATWENISPTQLIDLFEVGQGAHFATIHYGKVDRIILEDNVAIALREDKWEAGHGEADV